MERVSRSQPTPALSARNSELKLTACPRPAQTGVSQNLLEVLETSNEVRTPTPPSPLPIPELQLVPLTRLHVQQQQTDVSRLQSLELAIQERVGAELRRLREQEAEALREAQQKLAAEPPADQPDQQQQQLPSRQAVSKAVEDLRAKLEERRRVRDVPESVDKARNEVVRCLRENDRRPLDCWREVEAFKEEVRKMEKGWVDKVIS